MRQTTLIALGLIVGLGLALGAMAAEKNLVAQGAITAIDAKARTLTVGAGQEQLTIKLAANAEILAAGKPVALDTLKKGEQVRVEYMNTGDSRTGHRLELVAAPASARAAANKPAASSPKQSAGAQPAKK
jgi:hypothetical protein